MKNIKRPRKKDYKHLMHTYIFDLEQYTNDLEKQLKLKTKETQVFEWILLVCGFILIVTFIITGGVK